MDYLSRSIFDPGSAEDCGGEQESIDSGMVKKVVKRPAAVERG